jgi:hypothetical protein
MGAGAYWTRATKNTDQTIDVVANGVYGGGTRAVHLTLLGAPTLFDNAIFAGNSSKDPNYKMHFGGVGAQGDQVGGDIFSGGDVEFVGDAKLTGTARATGKVTGVTLPARRAPRARSPASPARAASRSRSPTSPR